MLYFNFKMVIFNLNDVYITIYSFPIGNNKKLTKYCSMTTAITGVVIMITFARPSLVVCITIYILEWYRYCEHTVIYDNMLFIPGWYVDVYPMEWSKLSGKCFTVNPQIIKEVPLLNYLVLYVFWVEGF